MVSNEHIEESLSLSYVNAVVANSGQVFDIISRDYGVDGSVRRIQKINGKLIDMGSIFDCQLKATINWSINNNNLVYDMDADAYNRLILRNNNSTLPCLLILFCLPKNQEEWLSLDHDNLIIRKCCYYFILDGKQTTNTSSKRIHIPISNIFNCETLNYLMSKLIGINK